MCGRYRLAEPLKFATFSDIRLGGRFLPRFNIAPTQRIAAVLDEKPDEIAEVRWGLIPSWATDARIASSLINARAETVATKPAFRAAYRQRRCLVPADGFYEWQKGGAGKGPHHIYMRDGSPFAFAGLWESWRDPLNPNAEPVLTCTIITTTPNTLTATIHNRMPAILPREQYAVWLANDTPADVPAALLAPYPADEMCAHPISSRVNSPRYDDPTLIEPATPVPVPIQGDLFNSA